MKKEFETDKPSFFLREHPATKKFKNKRTKKSVEACRWGANVRVTYCGTKYLKSGQTVGYKNKFITYEEFDKKYYLHDNAI